MNARVPVTLEISWVDLFGARDTDMTAAERRERWNQWAALTDEKDNPYWTDVGNCYDEDEDRLCHLCDDGWCLLMGLPCGVSPITTMRMNAGLGRACMSYIPKRGDEIQLSIW